MKQGTYAAAYFLKTEKIMKQQQKNAIVTLQFFQRQEFAILGGINEVVKLLKKVTPSKRYKIHSLKEGSQIKARQVVLELEGQYQYFGKYEGVIDGILSRITSIATNAWIVKKAARQKTVIFMGDRADHYLNQSRDGYAAALGGITNQVTAAQVANHSGVAFGTMPHILIQMFKGDLIAALHAYEATFPTAPLVALVDFNNDVITDACKALATFGLKLQAVRVDTSPNLSDQYFAHHPPREFGVTPNLIKALRKALNQNNGKHVKIIVSSGFDAAKIAAFEAAQAPVDVYGVGQSILRISHTFTGDATKINGQKVAKAGRTYKKI